MAIEFFDVVVFSVVYGLLLLVMVTHVFVKWQLRRRSLRKWWSAVPGDSSFKLKRMKQQLVNDFQAVGAVTSDPRLINHNLSPSAFGMPKGCDDTVYPPHWQRMRAIDAAADFVASHHHLVDFDPTGQHLPQFLSTLQQQQILVDGLSITQQLIDCYNNARTNPGDFTESMFDEFTSLLLKISQCHLTVRRKPHVTTTTAGTVESPV